MYIPFIGRLNLSEYLALFSSFFLVGLEALIRILTLALPSTIISLFYRASRRVFNRYTTAAAKKSAIRKQDVSTSIRNASDFVDLCALAGYYAEEHVVQTGDGYLLGIHRLGWKKGEEGQKVNSGPNSIKKNVVYLHHGLLMNSEVWVCLTDEQRCLPFTLVEKGYDVWLGNNRGNKYSKKSVHHSPMDIPFWDFSMDEFAFHDVPDTIKYILETTSAPSLSYIGFSQGTAQAFATLAVHPKLNDQINVFIALAPAMSPAGLSNGIVDALVKASPQVLFLLFGRRSILSSATMWQSILYPPIFVRLIDMGLSFLFGWRARNISTSQKLAAYPHLYSFTSTKSVVHWFQIIRTKSFQMYDDDVQPVISLGSVSKYTKVAKFPTRNIKTPVVLVYGGSDSLVDIDVMLKELPAHTMATEIPHYEHLDFLWAREVDTLVFPHVFDALESFCDAEHSKEEYETYRRARTNSIRTGMNNSRMLSYMSEEDSSSPTLSGSLMDAEPATTILQKGDESPGDLTLMNPENTSNVYSDNTARKRVKLQQLPYTDDSAESDPQVLKLLPPPTPNSKHAAQDEEEKATAQAPTTPSRIPITSSLPSHNQMPGETQTPTRFRRSMRSASIGSNISFETGNGMSGISPVGISVGVGRAVGGLLSSAEGIRGSVTSSDENGSGKRSISVGEGTNKGFGFGGSLRRKK